jgi:hypothetical protein
VTSFKTRRSNSDASILSKSTEIILLPISFDWDKDRCRTLDVDVCSRLQLDWNRKWYTRLSN